MKIIKSPNPVKCKNCGCVFEFDRKDIRTDYYWDPHAFLGILPMSKRCVDVHCQICNDLYIIKEY